jgi:hypothetical protein
MPLVQPMPFVRGQWFDTNGNPVANGFLYTYIAGTNTPLASYNDHTGGAGALNPNPVQLDSGGYADVWLTAASYKLILQDANHVQIWSIDGVPGLGSLITVGDLPPLFTSVLAGGALNFTLSNAAAHTLFGRFAGTTGAPSYGAVGSDKQVTFNKAGEMVGSDNLLWDDTALTLSLREAGNAWLSFHQATGTGEGEIVFGNAGGKPRIKSLNNIWQFTSRAGTDVQFGPDGDPEISYVMGGGFAVPIGTFRAGEASHNGILYLNDGTSIAGVFAGAKIIMGFQASPEGVIAAETGSIFLTTAGGASTTLWVKESSPTATTGWVGK